MEGKEGFIIIADLQTYQFLDNHPQHVALELQSARDPMTQIWLQEMQEKALKSSDGHWAQSSLVSLIIRRNHVVVP